MNEGRTTKQDKESAGKSDDAATQKAEEAAEALRTALQSKGEQGKSSLGSRPDDEDKTD